MSYHLGLIGYPLEHSFSPRIHTAALRSCGLRGDYSLFPVALDDIQAIKNLLVRVRSNEIHGLNVTTPHKQNVIPLLDDLTPTAQAVGAVNTIYLKDKKILGDNTDAAGFLLDLTKLLDIHQSKIKNACAARKCRCRKSAMVLGAGGAARAVVHALLNDGWDVTITARRIEQAQHLANSITNRKLRITNYIDLRSSTFDLLVNTTPVGMAPNIDQSPWPGNLPFPSYSTIYDLVYNPRETKLVKDACSQGLYATSGLGMLIEQAALAFEIWTGHKPPREVMFHAVNQIAN